MQIYKQWGSGWSRWCKLKYFLKRGQSSIQTELHTSTVKVRSGENIIYQSSAYFSTKYLLISPSLNDIPDLDLLTYSQFLSAQPSLTVIGFDLAGKDLMRLELCVTELSSCIIVSVSTPFIEASSLGTHQQHFLHFNHHDSHLAL